MPVIQVAAITRWRIASEVPPLQWRQVDLAAGEVRLDAHTTKNREGRVFPFTRELRAVLEAQPAGSMGTIYGRSATAHAAATTMAAPPSPQVS